MDATLIHGNTRLVFESGAGDSLVPKLYLQREAGEMLSLDGTDFLSIRVGDQRVPARIKRASAGDVAEFTAEFPGMDDWQVVGRIVRAGDDAERLDWRIQIGYIGEEATECAFHIAFRVPDSGVPRWMVPAMFYKHNRPESCVRRYPRYAFDVDEGGVGNGLCPVPEGGVDGPGQSPAPTVDDFVSNYWAFRSDRSSCPSVFCWTDNLTTCLATPETFSHSTSGVGFRGDSSGTFLYLNYPYVEEPVKYSFVRRDGQAPESYEVMVMPREAVQIAFSTYIDERDLHAYDGVIRDLYNASDAEGAPWVSMSEAEDLLAYGLHRWHYDAEKKVIYETCAFDKCLAKGPEMVDRPHMHVAWVSGAPYAFALWKYGARVGNAEYVEAGLSVLDKIADEGVSPIGVFYPEWTAENGWGTGWNPKPEWIQARTVSEATWFYFQALEYAKETHKSHPNWAEAAKSNLEYAVKVQQADGNFGSYYNINTGACEEWDGAGGIMWIPALLAGAKYFGSSWYREAAIKAGAYYAKFVEDEYIYGAPEDVHLTPTSEDAYNALIAYLHLYETTQDAKWLEPAKSAADLVATFRWVYNSVFDEDTLLGKYGFRTLGADIASPSNNHLHNYGLICHPEMLRLWQYTGDTYYLARAADHLACFHQFIARIDGDFNARRGMITEQWFHTDWTHAKGSMLQLSHSWCAGLILYADMYTHEFGDIVIDIDSREVYVFDTSYIEETEDVDGDLVLTLANPSPEDQRLRVRHSKLGIVGEVTVPAVGESRIRVYSTEPRIEELAGQDDMWR